MARLKIHGQEVEFALNQDSGSIPRDTTAPALDIPAANPLKFSGLTPGAIAFIDSNNLLSTDPSYLFWHAANKALIIGGNTYTNGSDKLTLRPTAINTGLRIIYPDHPALNLEGSLGTSQISGGDSGRAIYMKAGYNNAAIWQFSSYAQNYFAEPADASNTTRPANTIRFVNRYWNGTASADSTHVITPVVSADGTGRLDFSIAGSNVFSLSSNGLAAGLGIQIPHTSAKLDISSTTRGFLPPRMTTTQRDAIATPSEGLQIFNTTTKKINYYDGTVWQAIA